MFSLVKHRRGFTLIELVLVVSIISLLTTIILAALSDSRAKARDVKRIEDIKQLQIALELYRHDTGVYPSGTFTSDTWTGSSLETTLRPYIPQLPIDPLNGVPNYYYRYDRTSCCCNPGDGGKTKYYLEIKTFEKNPTTYNPNFCNQGSYAYTLGSYE